MEVNFLQSVPSTEKSSQVAKSSGATNINLTKFEYTWMISNFSFYEKKPGVALSSPQFVPETKSKNKWYLKLYPNGVTKEYSGYISLYLMFVPVDNKSEVEAKYTFSILTPELKKVNVTESSDIRTFNQSNSSTFGFKVFVKKSFLLNAASALLPDDTLTVVCDIVIVKVRTQPTKKSDSVTFKLSKCRLVDDLNDLFESPRFCDVTLIACGQEFQAHKAILTTRSPVFAAMFQHEMLEQQQNRVEIDDMNADVLREILRFIYTGKTPSLDKMADSLLAAADKYELERLKGLCERALCRSLSIENAASHFRIGDLYSSGHLKAQALDFICTYTNEVLNTSSYKSMHNTHPHLVHEAFQALATKKAAATASEVAVSANLSNDEKSIKK